MVMSEPACIKSGHFYEEKCLVRTLVFFSSFAILFERKKSFVRQKYVLLISVFGCLWARG